MNNADLGERALILAPTGRDSGIAQSVLAQAGIASTTCEDISALITELRCGAGTALITEEALRHDDTRALHDWIEAQPRWSDFPFVALTSSADAVNDGFCGIDLLDLLCNATLLERPIQAVTLISAVRSALRARHRQYEVAAYFHDHEEKELELRRLNGSLEHRVEDRTRRLVEANRRLLSEIEERRRTEDALRQAQKMQAVGQLTGGIAHDFNNLLTVISGNIELLQSRLGDDRRLQRLAAAAATGVDRASKLTQQLLAFSRKQHLEPRPIDLNTVVTGMAELLRRTVGEEATFSTELAPDIWMARADPNQVEAALLNLVINARDAIPKGGKITVTTANVEILAAAPADTEAPSGGYVELAVQDTGYGMSPDVAARAFEPFFTTKGVGKGSGLGLSMVHGFVHQSRGYVRIVSEKGRGTRVSIYLPRAELRAEPEKPRPAPQRDGAPPLNADGKILIVEDSDEVRQVAVSVLADFGFNVLEAADAATALDILARSNDISLVFSDVVMPGDMNGIDLARAVAERWPGLRFILTSGYAERLVDGDTMPPHIGYLHKPYKPLDLVSMIRNAIMRTAPSGAGRTVN